jgi:hypothetical protein
LPVQKKARLLLSIASITPGGKRKEHIKQVARLFKTALHRTRRPPEERSMALHLDSLLSKEEIREVYAEAGSLVGERGRPR